MSAHLPVASHSLQPCMRRIEELLGGSLAPQHLLCDTDGGRRVFL